MPHYLASIGSWWLAYVLIACLCPLCCFRLFTFPRWITRPKWMIRRVERLQQRRKLLEERHKLRRNVCTLVDYVSMCYVIPHCVMSTVLLEISTTIGIIFYCQIHHYRQYLLSIFSFSFFLFKFIVIIILSIMSSCHIFFSPSFCYVSIFV